MLFSLLKHHLDLFVADTVLCKCPDLCTFSLFLYFMVLKTISPACGVQAFLMLFYIPVMCFNPFKKLPSYHCMMFYEVSKSDDLIHFLPPSRMCCCIIVTCLVKRPARDACLCMGELPAPHFVFLITL